MKCWTLLEPDRDLSMRIASELGVSDILADLLVNRGVNSPEAAREFLEPEKAALYDPFRMPGMEGAVRRVLEAVVNREKVLIHGDYDVDGLTATAIMATTLSTLGLEVFTFIPERLVEGYGVSPAAIEGCPGKGISLVITVDCGISATKPVDLARTLGVDVVVTDHHPPRAEIPNATALTDPHLEDGFPNRDLSGAGVAYHFVRALKERLGPSVPDFPEVIDLVALGTLADAMRVTGENRTLIARGLAKLRDTERPGILGLLDQAGLVAANLNTEGILFQMAPRLNSLGRMGSASVALDLLMTDNWAKARELAIIANDTNRKRRRLQDRTFKEIEKTLSLEPELAQEAALVFWNKDWHRGVIGIVASQLVDLYHKPSFVLTVEKDGYAYGSARSPDGFDVAAGLHSVSYLLESQGGHSGAGGFHLREENLEAFRDAMCRVVQEEFSPTEPRGSYELDVEITLDRVDLELMEELCRLEPYGSGNPHPKFLSRGVETQCELQIIGNQHLRLGCHQGPAALQGIAFGKGDLLESMDLSVVDIVYEPVISRWRGQGRLELRIDDIQPSSRRWGRKDSRGESVRSIRVDSSCREESGHAGSLPAEGTYVEGRISNLRDCRGRRFPADIRPAPTDVVLFMAACEETCLAIREQLACLDPRHVFLESLGDDVERVFAMVYDEPGAVDGQVNPSLSLDHLVLWDLPFHRRSLEGPLRHTSYGHGSATIYLAFDEESFQRGRKRLEKIHPQRDSLGEIYRQLSRVVGETAMAETEVQDTAVAHGLQLDSYLAALEIFAEIGILERHSGMIRFLYPQEKRELTDSARYRLGQKSLSEYENLARFLLRARLEQIDRYLSGVLR